VPQKDRVTEVIRVLDRMTRRERNVIRALVTEAKAEYRDIPAEMPPGTQPEDMERASLYYEFESVKPIADGTEGPRSRPCSAGAGLHPDLGPAGLHAVAGQARIVEGRMKIERASPANKKSRRLPYEALFGELRY
jgi:hypothetical protein